MYYRLLFINWVVLLALLLWTEWHWEWSWNVPDDWRRFLDVWILVNGIVSVITLCWFILTVTEGV